ncbi:MAG: hypothetical protein Q9169_007266 [Polycauliona sp. 2 TL-2023]
MASAVIAGEDGIPSVTMEDLRTFHKLHFGNSTETVFDVEATSLGNPAQTFEDDHLGYYPDGVKRTLTDEQIAMFRHSEIYSLQRKRQLQKENTEADNESSDPRKDLDTQGIQPEGAAQAIPVSAGQSLDNFMKHYGPGGKNRCDFHTVEDTLINVMGFPSQDQANRGNITGTSKRRKVDNDERRSDYEKTTSRRQARELDDAVADVGFLDYGEESNVVQSIETNMERIKVDYTDRDEMTGPPIKQETVTPSEGRKIWWPTIG